MGLAVPLIRDRDSFLIVSNNPKPEDYWTISEPEYQHPLFSSDLLWTFDLDTNTGTLSMIYHPGSRAELWKAAGDYVDVALKLGLIAVAGYKLFSKGAGRGVEGAVLVGSQGTNGLNVFKDHDAAQKHFSDAQKYPTEGYYRAGNLLIKGRIRKTDVRALRS